MAVYSDLTEEMLHKQLKERHKRDTIYVSEREKILRFLLFKHMHTFTHTSLTYFSCVIRHMWATFCLRVTPTSSSASTGRRFVVCVCVCVCVCVEKMCGSELQIEKGKDADKENRRNNNCPSNAHHHPPTSSENVQTENINLATSQTVFVCVFVFQIHARQALRFPFFSFFNRQYFVCVISFMFFYVARVC